MQLNKSILFLTLLVIVFSTNVHAKSFATIAKVNNEYITELDLENQFNCFFKTLYKTWSYKNKNIVLQNILHQQIEDELKKQEALEKKISVLKHVVEETILTNIQQNNSSITEFRDYLEYCGLSYEDYFSTVEIQLLWKELIFKEIKPKVTVEEYEINEALEYFVKNPYRKRVLLSEINIPFNTNLNKDGKNNAEKIANNILEAINNNNYNKKSADLFLSSYGFKELTWFDESEMNPKILTATQSLKQGQITKPILIGSNTIGSYRIFKLKDSKIEKISLDKDERKRIETILMNQKLELAVKEYLIQLYNKSYIEIENF